MQRTYLVRYGLMHYVGRFGAESDAYRRGQTVVVQSYRGTELGEILAQLGSPATGPPSPGGRVLRPATADDLECARRAALDRPGRLDACDRIVRDGAWPLTLLDVEPLLDDRRTVVYYLGPHHLDAADLFRACRDAVGLEVVLEPAGRDDPARAPAPACCGSGGCGSGCSTRGGCSGCTIQDLVRSRRVAAG